MYTTAQIAEDLGIGQSTVRAHIASGALAAEMVGKTWLVRDVAFAVYKATRTLKEEIAAIQAQLSEANAVIGGLYTDRPPQGGGCLCFAACEPECSEHLFFEYLEKYLSEVNDGTS